MASQVKIDPQLRSGTGLSLNANSQKIRAKATFDSVRGFIAENFDGVQRAIDRIESSLRQAPNAGHIVIDSADIENLIVGGPNGPGQLTILSGPPSYTRIGFDGTEETDIVFTISSVSGATVTFTTDHTFEPGDLIRIDGNTSINHLGYWLVDDAPSSSTITLLDPPTGSGSGGTATFQYAGGWRRTFAIGGEGFDTAPFFGDSLGRMYIGKNGSISLLDTLNQRKGFIGVVEEDPQTITGASDNGDGLFRMTLVAHGYETGDDVVVEGLGDFAITKVTDDSFDLQGSTYGAYTLGEVYRYRGPFWGQSIAAGGTGYEDATFRTFRDGSLRIGESDGPRLEYLADEEVMALTDASISVAGEDGDGNNFEVLITPANVQISNLDTGDDLTLSGAIILLENTDSPAGEGSLTSRAFNLTSGLSGFGTGITSVGASRGFLSTWLREDGDIMIALNGRTGAGYITSLDLGAPLPLTSGGSGSTGASGARTNFDVYSKAEVDALIASISLVNYYTKSEVDALLAGYATWGHSHSTITIFTTSGGGVASHSHTGVVN